MKKPEIEILSEVTHLIDELEVATYGSDKHVYRTIDPSAYRFYLCAKQIYKLIDDLVAEYQPDNISNSDYYYICDCKRTTILELEVLKDNKRLHGQQLTWALEPYLDQMNDLFKSILDKEVQTLSRRE